MQFELFSLKQSRILALSHQDDHFVRQFLIDLEVFGIAPILPFRPEVKTFILFVVFHLKLAENCVLFEVKTCFLVFASNPLKKFPFSKTYADFSTS